MSHEFRVKRGGMIACKNAGARYEVVAATNDNTEAYARVSADSTVLAVAVPLTVDI